MLPTNLLISKRHKLRTNNTFVQKALWWGSRPSPFGENGQNVFCTKQLFVHSLCLLISSHFLHHLAIWTELRSGRIVEAHFLDPLYCQVLPGSGTCWKNSSGISDIQWGYSRLYSPTHESGITEFDEAFSLSHQIPMQSNSRFSNENQTLKFLIRNTKTHWVYNHTIIEGSFE